MSKINKYLKHPSNILIYLTNKNFFNWIPDKAFLEMKYRLIMKKKLDLENPVTFNEKLQWLKLYDRNPEYTKMVDKYEAKEYVSKIIGEEYIIPTLGVWDKFEDIDFEKLPNQFVLKPTHTSGNVYVCNDKKSINYKELRKKVNKWLKRKYFFMHREWPYKNVKPRIIAEKYMKDKSGELLDYKFYCFNGKPKLMLICSDRFKSMKETYFDMDGHLLTLKDVEYERDESMQKPICFEKMKEFAYKLSNEIPFLRVDFYEIEGKIYFGELTFYTAAGFEQLNPSDAVIKMGKILELPKEKKIEK